MYNSLPFTFIFFFIKNLSPMYTSGLSEASSSVSKSMFPCVSCNTKCAWRIKLRAAEIEMDSDNNEEVCGHIICISCMLAHLQEGIDAKKPRIKCPSKHCRKRLHENDIRALLDPENNDLDMFMERSTRKQLLYKHDVQTIEYAFGDSKNCVRNCPRCKNIYATKIGCNYVRCPNLGCNTWFCWECGEKDITWGHYVFDKCNPQWDDVLKGLYFISFLLFTGGFTLFYISLPVYLGLCGYFPLVVTFGTPIMILGRLRRQWIKRRCPQADRIRETKMLNWKQALLYWTLYTLLYILLLPLGSIVGLMAFGFSLILLAIFLIVLFIKLIPIVGQVVCILEIIQCITGCFGYGEWLHWYRKSKEKKDNEHIANRQFKMRVRERLMNPNVGR